MKYPLLTALAAVIPAALPAAPAEIPTHSANVEGGEGDGSDARFAKRIHVFLPATIETDRGEMAVTLRNLSCTGAMIEGRRPLEPGSAILFRRGLFVLLATVVWADGLRAGLHFDTPIDEGNLFVLTRRLPTHAQRLWLGHA